MFNFAQLPGLRRFGTRPSGERLHLLRYHGLWGPGVRLLQNLRFSSKVLLLLVSLMLPLGYALVQLSIGAWHDVTQSRNAGAALRVYRAAAAVHRATIDFGNALMAADRQPEVTAPVQGALKQVSRAAQDLHAVLDEEAGVAGPLGDALRMLDGDLARLPELAADQTATAEGLAPKKYVELLAIQTDIGNLQAAILKAGGAGLHDRPVSFTLYAGGLVTTPSLQRDLNRSSRAGSRVYLQGGRAQHAVRLQESATIVRSQVLLLQQHLESLADAGVADVASVRRSADALLAHSALLQRLVLAGLTARSESDVVRAIGVDVAGFQRQAHEAQRVADELQATVMDLADRVQQRRQRDVLASVVGMAIVAGLGLLLMGYLLVCVLKVVGGGLNELCLRVDALAKGDLSEKPQARGTDEVGRALTALAASTTRMSNLFEAVTQGVAAVSFASREVAIGNAGLNGRTGDIRRSIEDVGERARASMDAMNRAGTEVERIASHMRDVRADAHRSRKAMGELSRCMQGLQTKSREISRVVTLVESVAHQTRLLSLNASVEAARAGTAGKGFAVVAQEVRALARRSESAAHKIHEIVKASVEEIATGSLLTERVGDSVRQTDDRIGEVNAIMGDIVRLTQAGREQSGEVVGITRQVEDSASGNARMVEQLAHASAGLREQGDHLKRSMQHFVFG